MNGNVITISEEPKVVLETQVPALRRQASEIVVKTPEDRSAAELFVKQLRELKVEIEERFHPTKNKQDARKVYEQLMDAEKAFYVPIDEAIETVRGTVKTYDRKAALEARDAQEKADREQREAIEKEQDKILQESMRLKREGQNAADELGKASERLAAVKIELEEARERLAKAEGDGDKSAAAVARIEVGAKERELKIEQRNVEENQKTTGEKLGAAESLQEQAASVTVEPKPAPVAAQVKKLSWKCKVASTKIACRSIGEGLAPFTMVEFKQAELNKLAKEYDGFTRIPGFDFYEDVSGRV